jgi:hypothetical protein
VLNRTDSRNILTAETALASIRQNVCYEQPFCAADLPVMLAGKGLSSLDLQIILRSVTTQFPA